MEARRLPEQPPEGGLTVAPGESHREIRDRARRTRATTRGRRPVPAAFRDVGDGLGRERVANRRTTGRRRAFFFHVAESVFPR
ncbi:hypothetical protein Sme01_52900 [Sphaerisporangium melleum]|uniref:Uncharacterized protein n=1 Tax=Sphaerisporangium melleum TaxID=321316 RepID=A0A917R5C9_9ACTN|nr:hypothetical protein GCM10007964_36840 [Sphaerisporangium melleum]GII72814.1 hypothetical protein Sme01_52900 [Sphaerisporangium melleum]